MRVKRLLFKLLCDQARIGIQKSIKTLESGGDISQKEFAQFMPGGIYGRDIDFGPQGGDGPPPIVYPYPYPTSTAMAPAVVPPVVPPVQTANPFLPATNLPFATYGTAPHGAKFGVDTRMFADGGRIGYQDAGDVDPEYNGWKKIYETNPGLAEMHDNHPKYLERYKSETPKMAEGGLMNLGGMEKDYRQEGGFVPIGGKEKADDVPARLSKNEFVFTADAVRAAGGGDIDQGAEVMENLMENLEAGGQISEESQGLGGEEMISEEEMIQAPDGAQEMYEQQAMLQSRMA